jgi:SnoaL-like domain
VDPYSKEAIMGDIRELAAAVEAAFQDDFGQVASLLKYTTDDFVEEWPQSGERLTRPMVEKMAEGAYEAGSGTRPHFTYRRMLGGGDTFTVEGTIDYGDGIPVSYVGIGEVRDGKISRMTEYFANPFEPPAWRAGMTERMEPAKA